MKTSALFYTFEKVYTCVATATFLIVRLLASKREPKWVMEPIIVIILKYPRNKESRFVKLNAGISPPWNWLKSPDGGIAPAVCSKFWVPVLNTPVR